MIFEMEVLIQKALTSNPRIVNYVAKTKQGYPNIGANRVPHGVFPLIEYHQIYGSDEQFGSDRLLSRKMSFQIGIYSEEHDYYEIQNEVDREMRKLGFTCYRDYTYTMDDTKVIHRIFSYSISMNATMYRQLLRKWRVK